VRPDKNIQQLLELTDANVVAAPFKGNSNCYEATLSRYSMEVFVQRVIDMITPAHRSCLSHCEAAHNFKIEPEPGYRGRVPSFWHAKSYGGTPCP
jgi:hypothetical protein